MTLDFDDHGVVSIRTLNIECNRTTSDIVEMVGSDDRLPVAKK